MLYNAVSAAEGTATPGERIFAMTSRVWGGGQGQDAVGTSRRSLISSSTVENYRTTGLLISRTWILPRSNGLCHGQPRAPPAAPFLPAARRRTFSKDNGERFPSRMHSLAMTGGCIS